MDEKSVVLVTGSSSGFGRLMVETLARRGHTAWAGVRDGAGHNRGAADELRELASREHLPLHVLELDVTSEVSVDAAVRGVLDSSGRIDVVVNNAGYGTFGIQEAFIIDQVAALFDTNVYGPLRVNRAVLPAMREAGRGLLVQISSSISHLPMPFMGHYCASKAAAEVLAEVARYELSALGIDSVILEAGLYPTPGLRRMVQPADGRRLEGYGPVFGTMEQLGRAMEGMLKALKPDPQEVADALVSLVEAPAGTRPLRLFVGSVHARGAAELNTAYENSLADFYSAMGISSVRQLGGGG